MKVSSRQEGAPVFQPVSVTITFETEEQIGAFYAHFNVVASCDLLLECGVDPGLIRHALNKARGTQVNYGTVHGKFARLYTYGGASE